MRGFEPAGTVPDRRGDRDLNPRDNDDNELNRDDTDDTVAGPAEGTDLPRKIGGYSIRRRIASGGMGTVYEALQDHPRRTVAVKVMRQGVVSPEAARRFEYESQLLARLHHPGIAQVYEAGTHKDGEEEFPFFAMEYIPNARSITDYAREKLHGIRERLELFVGVCDAVHHGHQKGIIHRDLKPGNILVDSGGNPRIIDFGVARATDADMVLATFQTQIGQIIGSLQYMSPEQFDADPHDLDTRSDVYALGVVLYELLVGALPYDLSGSNIYDAARVVKEQPAPRPRTNAPSITVDVETILLKALEKDRGRRYQSAYGLAQDIRRYLGGEAIVAHPPSMAYQLRIIARRNKPLSFAVAALFVVLVAGVAISTSMFLRAEEQRKIAEGQTEKAHAAVEFLGHALKTTVPSDWTVEPTIADLLDGTAKRVDTAFEDDPGVEAQIRQTLGMGYMGLARWNDAEVHLARALELAGVEFGPKSPKTLSYLFDLSRLYTIMGRHESKMELRRRILDIQLAEHGVDHQETIDALYNLAGALIALERFAEAETASIRSLEAHRRVRGDDDEETLAAENQLAWIRLKRGELKAAEDMSRQTLEVSRRNYGERHAETRGAKSQLAAALITGGRIDEAGDVYGNREVPADMGIEKSFQGSFDSDAGGTQLFVFWETWCPFSQRAMPRLEEFYQRYRDQGFTVVGFTKITETSTDEKVEAFIGQNGLTFPVLKENGRASKYFGVQGYPSIVVVRDGRMVWEQKVPTSEPITETMLEELVRAGITGSR